MITQPVFENTYGRLPDVMFRQAVPVAVEAPRFVVRNFALAKTMGIPEGWLQSQAALDVLAGNAAPDDATPLAMAYAGHQFGHWVPLLGDGRAILLGEVVGPDGVRRDVQLKGAGRTAYSRNGDGRATLGAMLREYIVSEAMAGLGIPTTRSLAVVATGETVMREQAFPGAVLTRIAASHVRVGTFQFISARQDDEALRALADYEIARDYPAAPEGPQRFLWFLSAVIERQARLIAQWMSVGFIHGVMNTDNMAISGETIDYGPCAFMDEFHPQKVFSSIDHGGRYAWDKQPVIALWNLTRFAEALLPLLAVERPGAITLAEGALQQFYPVFESTFEALMAKKLGLLERRADDAEFLSLALTAMANGQADYTLFFSRLTELAAGEGEDQLLALFAEKDIGMNWLQSWRNRIAQEAAPATERAGMMRSANPNFIARNHRVEQAIQAANLGDLNPLHRLLKVVATPFGGHPENAELAEPPHTDEIVNQTFCGT
jgi:serine/tyrosine/threonine adenylyltransferase